MVSYPIKTKKPLSWTTFAITPWFTNSSATSSMAFPVLPTQWRSCVVVSDQVMTSGSKSRVAHKSVHLIHLQHGDDEKSHRAFFRGKIKWLTFSKIGVSMDAASPANANK